MIINIISSISSSETLLNGQEFWIDYKFENGWFVFIVYNKRVPFYKRFKFSFLSATIKSYASKEDPTIYFYVIGKKILKYSFNLKVNNVHFFDEKISVKQHHLPILRSEPHSKLKNIELKSGTLIIKELDNFTIKNNLLNSKKNLIIDFEKFKQKATYEPISI